MRSVIQRLDEVKGIAEDMRIYTAVHPFRLNPAWLTMPLLIKEMLEPYSRELTFKGKVIRLSFTMTVAEIPGRTDIIPQISISYQGYGPLFPPEEECHQIASYFFDDMDRVTRISDTLSAQFVELPPGTILRQNK